MKRSLYEYRCHFGRLNAMPCDYDRRVVAVNDDGNEVAWDDVI